jgi:hypothetical protein
MLLRWKAEAICQTAKDGFIVESCLFKGLIQDILLTARCYNSPVALLPESSTVSSQLLE